MIRSLWMGSLATWLASCLVLLLFSYPVFGAEGDEPSCGNDVIFRWLKHLEDSSKVPEAGDLAKKIDYGISPKALQEGLNEIMSQMPPRPLERLGPHDPVPPVPREEEGDDQDSDEEE